jgi:hypothetical protein
VAYPVDGDPNLRPGAGRIPFNPAARYDPNLSLDDLFEDFLAGSASIINTATERLYRYDWTKPGSTTGSSCRTPVCRSPPKGI